MTRPAFSVPRCRRLGTPFLALLLLVGALGVKGCQPDEEVVVLAVATSPSMLEAAAMGIEAGMAAHPGLILDTLLRVESTGESGAALGVARSLVETGKVVAVIGHANSSGTLAAAPLYREAGLVHLSPTATSPLLSGIAPRFFRMVPSDEAQGHALAALVEAEAGESGGPLPLALLWVNDPYGQGLREAFLREATERRGLDVVLDLPHDETGAGRIDPEETLRFLQASGARTLVFLGRAQSLQRLLPLLRERLGDLPVFGSDGVGVAIPGGGTLAAPGWEGIVLLDLAPVRGTEALDRFDAAYRARTGRTRTTSGEVLAHDAGFLLVEGLARGHDAPEALATWLGDLARTPEDLPAGLLAGRTHFDERGDGPGRYTALRVGPGGALTPVAVIENGTLRSSSPSPDGNRVPAPSHPVDGDRPPRP